MTDVTESWLEIPDGATFGAYTLPYGVFSTDRHEPRVGAAAGSHVIDLAPLAAAEGLVAGHVFDRPSLNAFLALGRPAWQAVREWLLELVSAESRRDLLEPHLIPMESVRLHMPFDVADYVDFYSSLAHAENLGKILRPGSPSLPGAWRHLPIGYHGRSATVIPSGADIIRPSGLRRDGDEVAFGPSTRLDIEAEVGFVVGTPSERGRPIRVEDFTDHVFGMVLVNDWSARDLQAFEYVPLGPFLGKSFATSISCWVVPLAALEHARVEPPAREPKPAEYLADSEPWGLDLRLEVEWNATVVSHPPFAQMYWTPAQQLAHLTANGAAVRTGELFASGTVSGSAKDERGSFVELSWNGAEPVVLADGSTRDFLRDGDTVTIRAAAPGPGGTRLGLGEVTGTIRPA